MKQYLAISQYGDKDIVTHPAKDLKAKYGGRVSKMYVDTKTGETKHVGYVIGSLWFSLFEIKPYEKVTL